VARLFVEEYARGRDLTKEERATIDKALDDGEALCGQIAERDLDSKRESRLAEAVADLETTDRDDRPEPIVRSRGSRGVSDGDGDGLSAADTDAISPLSLQAVREMIQAGRTFEFALASAACCTNEHRSIRL
jgi:hypothetical protein